MSVAQNSSNALTTSHLAGTASVVMVNAQVFFGSANCATILGQFFKLLSANSVVQLQTILPAVFCIETSSHPMCCVVALCTRTPVILSTVHHLVDWEFILFLFYRTMLAGNHVATRTSYSVESELSSTSMITSITDEPSGFDRTFCART